MNIKDLQNALDLVADYENHPGNPTAAPHPTQPPNTPSSSTASSKALISEPTVESHSTLAPNTPPSGDVSSKALSPTSTMAPPPTPLTSAVETPASNAGAMVLGSGNLLIHTPNKRILTKSYPYLQNHTPSPEV